jgi:hypothetical protein
MIISSKDMVYETELLEEKLYKGTDAVSECEDVSLVERENYGGYGAQKIGLDDVVVQTYSIEGTDKSLYICRFADKSN